MQTNTMSAAQSVKNILNLINKMRGTTSFHEYLPSTLYVLYGYHKQYPTMKINSEVSFDKIDDQLLRLIYDFVLMSNRGGQNTWKLYESIADSCIYQKFEGVYVDLLENILEEYCINGGKTTGASFTPNSVNQLMAYFVNKEKCQSIYDPFCGSSSIAKLLDANIFIGSDLNPFAEMVSEIMLDAIGNKQATLLRADSIENWQNTHVDAVVSCPPFNMALNIEHIAHNEDYLRFNCKTIEEFFVNSTSKCKITKCFCKSTLLELKNSISFLVSH